MEPSNLIKRLGKWTAPVVSLVMGLLLERLLELFLPPDIKTDITLFLGIPPGLIIITVAAILSGAFIVWVLLSDDPQLPIIFGGRKLRKIEPLVMECLALKEADYSEQWFPKMNVHLTAKRLSEKFDELRIPHPSLLVDRHERQELLSVMVFLHKLRRWSGDGNLKRAPSTNCVNTLCYTLRFVTSFLSLSGYSSRDEVGALRAP